MNIQLSQSAHSVTVDSQGNIVIGGGFNGTTDFDPTSGVDMHAFNGGSRDAFITRLLCDDDLEGDMDDDGDVDQRDFGHFQVCLSGPGIAPDSACRDADLHNDNDVDADDFIKFMGCMSGPNIDADPSCAD